VIAATNHDLPALVERGHFRRDLYARLALWEIRVPPLRERRADLPIWTDLFRAAWNEHHRAQAPSLELNADAWELLLLHPWVDNLRGVDRVVQRLSAAGVTVPVERSHLEALLGPAGVEDETPSAPERPPPPSREELAAALAAHGSVRAVAKVFGRDRRQIYRWMRALGLER
jgi:DNA-binding NtrC family response regulator